jgi:aspartate kinase
VARTIRRGNDVVLVVSAMGKETDELIRLAHEVSGVRPGREMDMLITAGERKAMALLCMALHSLGVEADSFTGSQAGFITDVNHGNAKILELRPERILFALEKGRVPVVGGSQGVSVDRDVTFLGRGGSDTTAVALAHALGADACELYTDVSGVFTADPRLVPRARRMAHVSFDELLEMTASGCPKPAMRSVEYARRWGVKLHVRSAFTWEPGTWVHEEDPSMEQAIVSAVTHDVTEAKVTVSGVPDKPGIAARLFREMAEGNVNVDMIVQNVSDHGVTDISFTVPKNDLEQAVGVCQALAADIGATGVASDADIGRVSIVGAGMKSNPGVAATMFATLANDGINIEMISTSAIRISCVVRSQQIEDAVGALHTAFGLDA